MNFEFVAGFFAATIMWTVVAAGMAYFANQNCGYTDRMTITYSCPEKDYERSLFKHVVDSSGIQTNFLNKSFSMDKHRISVTLTNPKDR